MGVYENVITCKECGADHGSAPEGIDMATHPTAKKLAERSYGFLAEIKNLTPGHDLEARLNKEYGPGNPYFDDFCKLVKQGFEEGWVAGEDLDNGKYRRGKVQLPLAENSYMSLTCVYFDSEAEYAGQYHKHPYGEINCVIPIDEGFQLEGLPVDKNWRGAGWTSVGPGTHHFPRARGGKGFAYFFLPSGRIAYDARPEDPQPASV